MGQAPVKAGGAPNCMRMQCVTLTTLLVASTQAGTLTLQTSGTYLPLGGGGGGPGAEKQIASTNNNRQQLRLNGLTSGENLLKTQFITICYK